MIKIPPSGVMPSCRILCQLRQDMGLPLQHGFAFEKASSSSPGYRELLSLRLRLDIADCYYEHPVRLLKRKAQGHY